MFKISRLFIGLAVCAVILSGCAGGMGQNKNGSQLGATIAGSDHPALSMIGAYVGGHS